MKDHFPLMEYQEIPGAGHFIMLEKPEEFGEVTFKGFQAYLSFRF